MMHTPNFSDSFSCQFFNYLAERRHVVQIDSNMSNLLITNFGVHHGPVLFNLCVADDILSYVRYNCVDKMHHCRGSEEVTFSFTKLLFTVKY